MNVDCEGVTERLIVSDCKSVGFSIIGSNPIFLTYFNEISI